MENYANLSYDVLLAQPRIEIQLFLGIFYTILFGWFIPTFARVVVRPTIMKAKWKRQWITVHKSMYEGIGMKDIDDEFVLDLSSWTVPMLMQHGLGGLLAIPGCFGFFSLQAQHALASHGTLVEFGFELYDCLSRGYKYFFGTPREKAASPPALLKLLIAHHMVGISLTIPINMYLRGSSWACEANLLLQGASFFCLFLQQYGYTLNHKNIEDAWKMKMISLASLVIILYSRVFRYTFVVFKVNQEIYSRYGIGFLAISLFCACGLTFFNSVMVSSGFKKLKKFSLNYDQVRKNQTTVKPGVVSENDESVRKNIKQE